MSVDRLAALAELLAQPDPRWLKRRGHVLTQPGKRDRWTETWLPAAQIWTAQRLSEATDPEDGWTPATRLPAFLRSVQALQGGHLELVVREHAERHHHRRRPPSH